MTNDNDQKNNKPDDENKTKPQIKDNEKIDTKCPQNIQDVDGLIYIEE